MAGISQARRDDSTSAGLACDDLAAGTAKAACRTMIEGFRVLAEFNSWAKRWNGRVHKRRSHPYHWPQRVPSWPVAGLLLLGR